MERVADAQALIRCHDLDIWLAAHLGDVFDKLAMIPDDEARFETSLRDYFILEYAELLQNNPKHPALWRIICDYLAAAGDEGRSRLRMHIQRVSLDFDVKGKNKEANGDAKEDGVEAQFRHFTEVLEACRELKLDEEWSVISKVMADRLMRRGNYGLAATMCQQAEDGYALSRIAEKILDAYLNQGAKEFLQLVETLPRTFLSEGPAALAELQDTNTTFPLDLPGQTAVSVFASRLTFLSELRDYLLFLAQGARDRAAARLVNLLTSGIAPVGFWAVLLVESVGLLEGVPCFLGKGEHQLMAADTEILFTSNDSFELLRVLQEVLSNASFAPNEYLLQLAQYIRRKGETSADEKAGIALARRKLEEVRLALARNLARALVVGFDNPF